jgi:hypothetical protein
LWLVSFASFAQATNTSSGERSTASKVLPVRLQFAEHQKYHLKLYNYDGDHLLWEQKGRSQGQGELFMIDPQPYTSYGLKKFKLIIQGKNKIDTVYFRVDSNGTVIKE